MKIIDKLKSLFKPKKSEFNDIIDCHLYRLSKLNDLAEIHHKRALRLFNIIEKIKSSLDNKSMEKQNEIQSD